jgi:subtilisin family serine protease
MRMMRHWFFLACAVSAIGVWQADNASAVVRFGRGPGGARPPAARAMPPIGPRSGPPRTFANLNHHGFNGPPGPLPGHQIGHGRPQIGSGRPQADFAGRQSGPGAHGAFDHRVADHGPAGSRLGRGFPHGLQHGPGLGHQQQFHVPAPVIAGNGLPRRPLPGEAGFTGVPPQGENRFVSHEMIVHVGVEVSPQVVDAAARRLGLTPIGTQNLAFSGGRLIHYRLSRGDVPDAIRTLESEHIGIAQPNYVFQLQQDARIAAPPLRGDPAQYVIDKLHIHDAHTIASGANVTVAVIDSQIDTAHPDLAGSIAGQYDAVRGGDKPDEHGTGMTGAIAAHRRLLGIAPRARILAIHAFSPDAQHPQQATSQSIIAGIDWAIARGARVINMSFAGPYDPLLQLALKKAHDKGVVLIAAAGNMGPQSPPLYPAADENVIAVTAVDEKDKLMPQANQGPHVALAAPGVNVLEAAPHASYNFTTGTSVAAAHVSGVVALLLERSSDIDAATIDEVLFSTAKDLGAPGRDPMFGYGLVDPYRALNVLEAKMMARSRGVPETTASAPKAVRSLTSATTSADPPPGAAGLISGAPAGPIVPAAPRVSTNSPAGEGAPGRMIPPQAPVTPAALPQTDGEESSATIEMKRQSCRQDGASRGVQASEIADFIAVCVSEARLACLKQAVAQKVQGAERRDFLNRCLQGS